MCHNCDRACGPGPAVPDNPTGTDQNILHVDKDNNMIFVGSVGSVIMVSYDSNDRYNINPAGDSTPVAASTLAGFEKSITASINIQRDGSQAKPYQVRQIRRTILRNNL